jgi:hypothetical protein
MDDFSTSGEPTDAELSAFLDEALAPERLAAIEAGLRHSEALRGRCAALLAERDAGGFTLGEIWRRYRLSCPTREELGSWFVGGLADERLESIRLHLEIVGCALCRASLADLRDEAEQIGSSQSAERRRRIFQSSVGRLRPSE